MRTPTSALRSITRSSSVALVAMLLGAGGCATIRGTIGAYDTGPLGIARPQQRLREALSRQEFAAAMETKEDDALLRALTVGVAAYYDGQYARSAAVLDSAALIADDRITASLSRDGLALLTNDMARPYQPRRTERLFIAYYGMMAWARLERWEDAAVEARRLSALLAQYADDRTEDEKRTHATLHYLAATVFERAGEPTSAQVAYANAYALLGDAPGMRAGVLDVGEGEILVIVERGFVAHRATESIDVHIGGDHDRRHGRAHDGDEEPDSSRRGGGDVRPRGVTQVAERVAKVGTIGTAPVRGASDPEPRRGRRDRDDDEERNDGDEDYWLSVAFPALRRAPRVSGDASIFVDEQLASTPVISALLDDAASADERRERSAFLVRATARAVAKYAVTKAVKDKKGDVAGRLTNIGASLLERADVRSWHLLPQELTLIRVRAPLGVHAVQLSLGSGAAARTVSLDPVVVQPGTVTLSTVRLWNDGQPAVVARR